MGDIAPIPLEYQGQMPDKSVTCPVCLKSIAKPQKCKTLYGVTVCNRCRNGFANRRQAAYLVDSVIYLVLGRMVVNASIGLVIGRWGNIGLYRVLLLLMGWLILPFLFTFKDAFAGWSPGKRLFGVRVVGCNDA